MLLHHRGQILPVGGSAKELVFSSFRVEKAAHRIELTQVEGQNFHDWYWSEG